MGAKKNSSQKSKRRGKNEGSIYQRADGKWAAQVTVGYDESGKRLRRTFIGETRGEVAAEMSGLVMQVHKQGYKFTPNDDLKTLMKHWLLIYKKPEVSSRTFEKLIRSARNHIFNEIGTMKLPEITTDIMQTLLNNLLDKLALDTVKKDKNLLDQFFQYAKDNHWIDHNPVDKTKIKSRDRDRFKDKNKDEYKAVRKEDRAAFMKALDTHPVFKPLCLTAMFCGCRIGEILALRWRDIDLEKGYIAIQNAITVVCKFDKEGNVTERKTVIGDTKTVASERENPMPTILWETLKEYRKRRMLEEALLGKSLTKPEDLVFSTNNGELRTYWGTNTLFRRFLEKHKLDGNGIHFHALRHTFSSMLFEAGENPKIVQALMGHKDVKTTMIYNSVEKNQYEKSTKILNKAFKDMDLE